MNESKFPYTARNLVDRTQHTMNTASMQHLLRASVVFFVDTLIISKMQVRSELWNAYKRTSKCRCGPVARPVWPT